MISLLVIVNTFDRSGNLIRSNSHVVLFDSVSRAEEAKKEIEERHPGNMTNFNRTTVTAQRLYEPPRV